MQFSSELDEETRRNLAYGQGLMRMLRQKQSNPLPLHAQVIMLVAGLSHCMEKIPLEKIEAFLKKLVKTAQKEYPELCKNIDENGDLLAEEEQKIIILANKIGG